MQDKKINLPTYELRHNNQEVEFAIRSTKDVMAMFGDYTDKPHRHDYYTVLWSHNHAGKHIVDYREFELKPNDIFFVSPGQVHQVIHNENPDGTVILFTCDFLSKNYISESFITNLNLFSEIDSTPPIKISDQSAVLMKDLIDKMRLAILTDDQFKNDTIGAYLKLFLIECNKYAHIAKSENPQTIQSGKVILKNFKDLLEINFSLWMKVSDYSGELNISSDYLNEVIKTTTGKTAKELIQQRIVLEAKRLGLHTDLSSKEIAYRLGFSDPSHFSKFFKNCEGESFTNFRNALNEALSR
jgi:AraC-like DNA-binding protein